MEYLRLDAMCNLSMGQSPSSDSYNQKSVGIPFFQGNADFGEMYPVTRVWCDKPTKVVDRGTLLISVRAPIGALNFATEKSCIGRGLAGLTVKKGYDLKYIYYALKYKEQELNNKGTGSTFKAISKSSLGEVLIPNVSIEKQKDCVKKLDLIRKIIIDKKEQFEKLDMLIKSRFVEMFGDPEYNIKNWTVVKLEKLCNIGSSKRIYQNEQSETGIPFLRIFDLVNRIDTGSKDCDLYIPKERFEELKGQGLVPEVGDILVTARGTLGRCYIIAADDEFYFQDGMITWLSKFNNSITPLYISYLFSMPEFRKQIDAMQAGSTIAYLSIAMARKLEIMVPPMELQNQFVDFANQVDKSKVVIQKSLDETQKLFDSLMQKYFEQRD